MTFQKILAGSIQEIRDTASRWRIAHLIGTSELRRRFARSRFGQFWLTLSTAIFTVALGVFWSNLLKQPVHVMLPYLAIGQILWLFIHGIILESTTAFQGYAGYLQNQYLPNGTVIAAIVWRNLLVLGYNSIIILILMVAFGLPLSGIPVFLVMLLCAVIALSCLAYVTAIFCVRFRDLIQVVASVMNLTYFFTPIFWKPSLLTGDLAWLLKLNPFATIIVVLRDPLLGERIDPSSVWLFALIIAGSVAVAGVFAGWLRHRIIFWV